MFFLSATAAATRIARRSLCAAYYGSTTNPNHHNDVSKMTNTTTTPVSTAASSDRRNLLDMASDAQPPCDLDELPPFAQEFVVVVAPRRKGFWPRSPKNEMSLASLPIEVISEEVCLASAREFAKDFNLGQMVAIEEARVARQARKLGVPHRARPTRPVPPTVAAVKLPPSPDINGVRGGHWAVVRTRRWLEQNYCGFDERKQPAIDYAAREQEAARLTGLLGPGDSITYAFDMSCGDDSLCYRSNNSPSMGHQVVMTIQSVADEASTLTYWVDDRDGELNELLAERLLREARSMKQAARWLMRAGRKS